MVGLWYLCQVCGHQTSSDQQRLRLPSLGSPASTPDTPSSVFPLRVLQKPWAASSRPDSFFLKHSSPEVLSGQSSLGRLQNVSAKQSPFCPEKTEGLCSQALAVALTTRDMS